MKVEDLNNLRIPLPEVVLRERMSGHFNRARQAIDCLLENPDMDDAMACRLKLELDNLDSIERTYTLSAAEALAQIQEKIPDMKAEELETLTMQNYADSFYIEGERRYMETVCETLLASYPDLWKRSPSGDIRDYSVLDALLRGLQNGQKMQAHIHIIQKLWIEESACRPGQRLRIYMPMPVENSQISNLRYIKSSFAPTKLPHSDETQPTVYVETESRIGEVFTLEYALTHTTDYLDMASLDPAQVATGEIPAAEKRYLQEQPPHICFTPYLRSLADGLRGGETNPLHIARRFYDFITTKMDYRFCRDYGAIDNLAEYGATERRGDCGVQALLFITLCRIAGIPARWQSGLDAKPGDVGEHDWAMFYVPSVGWRFADLSYGGSAYIRGAKERWNFFFGNIDPYRIPINSAFQGEFLPPMQNRRIDPYDNQCGEAEYADSSVNSSQLHYAYETVDIHLLR